MKNVLFLFLLYLLTIPAFSQVAKPSNAMDALCQVYAINCLSHTQKVPQKLAKSAIGMKPGVPHASFSIPENWTVPFYPQGPAGGIINIELEGDSVLVTGVLGQADSTRTWGVAVWSGQRWTSPVKEPPFPISYFSQIFKLDDKMYFCGRYDTIRTMVAWNGQGWIVRPFPHIDYATSMVFFEGKILIATFLDGIWQMDETQVNPFMPPIQGVAEELTVQNGKLWIRGALNIPGDSLSHGVAYLENGNWKFPTPIKSRSGLDWAWLGQEAFILDGRKFSYPQFDTVDVLKWDGLNWSRIPLDASAGKPRQLASDGKDLFLVGVDRIIVVDELGPIDEGLRVSKWDGQKFNLVDKQYFRGQILDAKAKQGRLYVGGLFNRIGNLRADNLAMWSGSEWVSLSQKINPGPSSPASAILSWGDNLVFGGGRIFAAGANPASGIAAWDGTTWSTFGKGIRSKEHIGGFGPKFPDIRFALNALEAGNGMLFAGGRFDSAGAGAARNIAKWDGSVWAPLGEGLPDPVRDIQPLEGDLFAVVEHKDSLPTDGTFPNGDVHRWNGASWQFLGELEINSYGHALAVFNGEIWGTIGTEVVKWNRVGWDTVHVNGKEISGLFAHKNALYAFSSERRLCKIDGNSLDTLPSIDFPQTLASDGEYLYATGDFDLPGYPNTTLARWDGQAWYPMANLSSRVKSMAVHGENLYVVLGDDPSGYMDQADFYLRWNLKAGTWSKPIAKKSKARKMAWTALPCAQNCFLTENGSVEKVFDLQGRLTPLRRNATKKAAGVHILENSP